MSITFDASVFTDAGNSTIVLASDLPMLFNTMTIDASAIAAPITIDGGNGLSLGQGHRAFFVSGLPAIPVDELPDPDGAQAIAVSLGNLIIQNALAQGGSSYFGGGGMGAGRALFVNKLATVTLEHVEFTTNTAGAGDSAVAGGGLSNFGGGGMGAGVQTVAVAWRAYRATRVSATAVATGLAPRPHIAVSKPSLKIPSAASSR